MNFAEGGREDYSEADRGALLPTPMKGDIALNDDHGVGQRWGHRGANAAPQRAVKCD